ncbi:MAG TPA: mechanosensitive ion channel family protein, partial [Planctomycetota bacterium]|nr:mechanosensitive ion channel family protein [Planctomycetota bacterium]
SLLVAGGVLFLVVRRNRKPSFLRDAVLILGLGLPLGGGALLRELLAPPDSPWRARSATALLLAATLFTLYAATRISITAIRWWGERSEPVRLSQGTLERILKLVVGAIGIVLVLEIFRIPVTPLLTTLGIGSLAVALALQDTLSNLFAGFYLTADRPMKPGDYVRLSTGEEGTVDSVGWRSTRLRTQRDNIVIVPNARLAQASITNYDLPDRRIAVSIRVPVAYGQDGRKAKTALETVARAALGSVRGLAPQPPPEVHFDPGFGDSALEFTLGCHVEAFDQQTQVADELRLRILDQFRREGIELVRSGPTSGPPTPALPRP